MAKSIHSKRQERLQALLVEARKSAGLTQVELAKRLRRSQSFVTKYERGERRLDVVEFLAVIAALRADPHKIIEDVRQR